MSVPPAVGLDVGNGKSVIAISNAGIADAVVNDTPSAVHFAGTECLFGSAASSMAMATPNSTITQMKRLVTRKTDLLPYETATAADGNVTVKVPYHNNEGERVFTSVETLAMFLGHLKRTMAGSMASACVIGVPSYFDDRQRRAYSDAAEIAGWNPLEVLNEGHAIALDYASSSELPAEKKRNVAFVDIGHCDTQVTVARFDGGRMAVVGEASDPDLGGRDFDEVLFGRFVGMLEEGYGIDVCSDPKAKARLRVACEAAKRVLSEKMEALVTVDCLIDGYDFKEAISREEFESLSSELVDRIGSTCRRALEAAGLGLDKVDAVEVVGSGSWIPMIDENLTGFFGKDLSRSLNGIECVARGCAVRCEKLIQQNEQVYSTRDGKGRKVETCITEAQTQEEQLLEQDRKCKRTEVARNSLESYMYHTSDEMKQKSTTEFDEVSSKLEEMEDLLNQGGNNESEDFYTPKPQELRTLADYIKISYKEEIEDQVKNQAVNSSGMMQERNPSIAISEIEEEMISEVTESNHILDPEDRQRGKVGCSYPSGKRQRAISPIGTSAQSNPTRLLEDLQEERSELDEGDGDIQVKYRETAIYPGVSPAPVEGTEEKGRRIVRFVPTAQLYNDEVDSSSNIVLYEPPDSMLQASSSTGLESQTKHNHDPSLPRSSFSKYDATSHVQSSSETDKEGGKFLCLPFLHKRNDQSIREENQKQVISSNNSRTLESLFQDERMDDAIKRSPTTEETFMTDSRQRNFKWSQNASLCDNIHRLRLLKFQRKRAAEANRSPPSDIVCPHSVPST